jgi:hypothetical protein
MERSSDRQVSALQRLSSFQRQKASFTLGQTQERDSGGIASQLSDLENKRRAFAQQARNVPMQFENRDQILQGLTRQEKLQEKYVDFMKDELATREKLRDSLNSELGVAQQILRTAQDTAIEEENRGKSELVRLGLLSRADQARVKRLYESAQQGPLSIRQAQQASRFGILGSEVAATATREAERSGVAAARGASSDVEPLRQARRNLAAAQSVTSGMIDEIQREISENNKGMAKLVEVIKGGFDSLESLGGQIDAIQQQIEDFKRETDKRWLGLKGWW